MPGHARRELSKLQENKYGGKTKLPQVAVTSLFSSENNLLATTKNHEYARESRISNFSRRLELHTHLQKGNPKFAFLASIQQY
jgi:hypothetical protein